MAASWAQLRQQARALESQTENLFHTYSQFSSVTNIPPDPTQEELDTVSKLEDTFNKRENIIRSLGRLLNSEAALTPSSVKQNNLSLLQEKLAQHRRDLVRLRTELAEARDRANLLSSVRGDIESYRQRNPAEEEGDYMLGERDRIDRSNAAADSVLSQAYAVNETFAVQRETLAGINRRITEAASRVPGLNSIIGRISARKRRDSIIMGVFIAACFLLVWWFM